MREAPSLDCIPILLDDGAKIKAYDPVAEENYKKIYPTFLKDKIKNMPDYLEYIVTKEW